MKRLVLVVFIGAMAACGKEEPAGSSRADLLIGTWELLHINDIGAWEALDGGAVRMTFRADGTFELVVADVFSVTTTGTYQVDGDRLRCEAMKIRMVDENGKALFETVDEGDLAGSCPDGHFSIEGDTLSITTTVEDEDGNESVVTSDYRRL